MLETIKALLGIAPDNTEKDVILIFLIETVVGNAKRFCKRAEIPKEMENLLIEIIVSRFRAQNYGSSEQPLVVTSVSDNGQSVGFKAVNTEQIESSGFTQSEERKLGSLFGRMWW